MLMNFMHSITILEVAGSGLIEVPTGAFVSVCNVYNDYPQNFRVMHLLIKEVLRSVIMTKLD